MLGEGLRSPGVPGAFNFPSCVSNDLVRGHRINRQARPDYSQIS
jgi:hypothetical protein